MTIPEPVTAKYESAVKGAARDAYKAYGHIYPKRELVGEAWGIAGDRWETWRVRTIPRARQGLISGFTFTRGARGTRRPTDSSATGLRRGRRDTAGRNMGSFRLRAGRRSRTSYGQRSGFLGRN